VCVKLTQKIRKYVTIPITYNFFFFNRHCNPCGLWPAQLSLSILSRKVFTDSRCQRHVKPPTWRISDWNVPTPATWCPSRLKRRERTPAAEGGTMGEKFPRIFPRHFWVLLHAVNLRHGTDGFTSPPKARWGFFRPLRPGLNPRTSVPKASTLTSRPPKPLIT